MVGRATVLQFVEDGCTKLVITDLVAETLKTTAELAKSLNEKAIVETVAGDITSDKFVDSLVLHALTTFGRLDYAVNNAGIAGKGGPTHLMEFNDYQLVQKVNIDALWMCERAELRAMVEQPLIKR